MSELRSLEEFTDYLGERFQLDAGLDAAIELELVEANRVGEPIPEVSPRHPFSLVFRGPRDLFLPQRTYRIENESFGELALMLVPIGPDAEGLLYQAIFA